VNFTRIYALVMFVLNIINNSASVKINQYREYKIKDW